MNEPPQPPIGERSPLVRFGRWLFSWRTLRRTLIGIGWTATLIALLYGEENWRGWRAWSKYRQALEAAGEQLDVRAFIAKPIPDEQNFAATPFIKSWFARSNGEDPWDDDYLQASKGISDPGGKPNSPSRSFMDLVAWAMAFDAVRSGNPGRRQRLDASQLDPESRAKAAASVLEGLKGSEASLNELRAASQRPYSQYPVIYDLDNPWGIRLPHLSKLRAAVLRLRLKACAELAAGRSEDALQDVKLMFYLVDSVKDEIFLISSVVRLVCWQLALQPIWEGLAGHRWSEAQLLELQTRLQQCDFVTDLKRPLAGERAAGILTADLLVRKKYRLSDLIDKPEPTGSLANVVGRVVPRGWYYQEQLNYCRLYQEQLNGTLDAARKTISPSRIAAHAHELERQIAGGRTGKGLKAILHHQVLATMLLPALSKPHLKAATAQTAADQAALACALERYRLANGQFPERLELLAPRFLSRWPHDVITGEPYQYRRTDDGQFLLYSVGWNERDDGGAPGNTLFDENQGDWVWEYPPP